MSIQQEFGEELDKTLGDTEKLSVDSQGDSSYKVKETVMIKEVIRAFTSIGEQHLFEAQVLHEKALIELIGSPRIIHIHRITRKIVQESHTGNTCMYRIFMDYIPGPTLNDVHTCQTLSGHVLYEKELYLTFLQLANILETIHSKDLVHLNISLENVICSCKSHLVVTNFGEACFVPTCNVESDTSFPSYASPELARVKLGMEPLKREYYKPIDIWALGILMLFLYNIDSVPYPPVDSAQQLLNHIYLTGPQIPMNHYISPLLQRCCDPDWSKRITASELAGQLERFNVSGPLETEGCFGYIYHRTTLLRASVITNAG